MSFSMLLAERDNALYSVDDVLCSYRDDVVRCRDLGPIIEQGSGQGGNNRSDLTFAHVLGTARHGTARHGTARHGTARHE
jgi:hypothetical protein